MSPTDFAKIKELVKKYQPDMTQFLRDMIRLPGESCRENAVIERIKAEMEKVGFDKEVITLFIIACWADLVLFFPSLVGVG